MIRLREYLADPEVFLAAEVQRLRPCLRILFHVIFFATDGAGRFNADAALLRTVLYTAVQQQVSKRDVQAWLCDLHRGGFIKLYTEKDAALGKVTVKYWRQRDVKRKVVHPDDSADPPGDTAELFTELSFPTELNRREGKGKTAAPRMPSGMADALPVNPAERGVHGTNTGSRARDNGVALPGHPSPRPHHETDAEWFARLALTWPDLDVPAQLAKAQRKRRGDVERGWFESVWLPGVTPQAPSASSLPKAQAVEPEHWRDAAKLVAHRTDDPALRERRLEAAHDASWASIGPDFRKEIFAAIRNAWAAA